MALLKAQLIVKYLFRLNSLYSPSVFRKLMFHLVSVSNQHNGICFALDMLLEEIVQLAQAKGFQLVIGFFSGVMINALDSA
jgi:hypothetical protein